MDFQKIYSHLKSRDLALVFPWQVSGRLQAPYAWIRSLIRELTSQMKGSTKKKRLKHNQWLRVAQSLFPLSSGEEKPISTATKAAKRRTWGQEGLDMK